MKKVNVSIELKVWMRWKGTPLLRQACNFPFSFLDDVAKISEGKKTLESFVGEFSALPAEGVDKPAILRTFKNANRMTVSLEELNDVVVRVSLFLYEPGNKKWSFCLTTMFAPGNIRKLYFVTTPWK